MGPWIEKKAFDVRTLLAVSARTASAQGSETRCPSTANGFAFMLYVTNGATDATDKLDVEIETLISVDGTTTGVWVPVVRFKQILGTLGAVTEWYVNKIQADGCLPTEFADGDALVQGQIRNVIGDSFRVNYTVTDGSGTPSFTFGVFAMAM